MTIAPDQVASVVNVASAPLAARLVPFRLQVQRHIFVMTRDLAEAEELTQEKYARALERSAQLRDPQAALAWLYRVATTVTLDRLRQRRPVAVPDEKEAAAAAERQRPPSLLESALERSEMSERVQGYLSGLPADYRIAILLHDAHGLSNPEIADVFGCSLATAKIRVHRARTRLREALAAACRFENRRARRARLRSAAGSANGGGALTWRSPLHHGHGRQRRRCGDLPLAGSA